jgi:hypothetical protein
MRAARIMGANGMRLVADRYTWRRIAGSTLDLYRTLSHRPLAQSA